MTLSRKLANLIVTKNVSVDIVIGMLQEYKMLGLLPLIKKSVEEIAQGESVRDSVMIESPFLLSDESIQTIKKIARGVSAHHTVTINKELLAGFKARYKEILYDGSAERIIKNFITK